ncbi:MAG: lamin tail domain-containing protein [Bacteroidales bacterium]|nr:lamin tail domain-containing protein [Bacteroidales bacterium]
MKQLTIRTLSLLRNIVFLLVFLFSRQNIFSQFNLVCEEEKGIPDSLWNGDVSSFGMTDDGMLILLGNENGKAYLSSPHSVSSDELEWHLRLNLKFAPSGNNFVRFYLFSDRSDLSSQEVNGLFLQFGENQSNDAIELFQQNGKVLKSLGRGTNELISNEFDYAIKVKKTQDNHWFVYVDETLCGEYLLDFECTTNPVELENAFFGFFCQFTSSYVGKYLFGELYCGKPVIDEAAPMLLDVKPLSDLHQVEVTFSEKVTAQSALNPMNYLVLETNLYPSSCQFVPNHYDKVILNFGHPFADRTNYTLLCSDIGDYSNNYLQKGESSFYFCKPQRNDVVISELMADPLPIVGLPAGEYIELTNRTERDISLANWRIQVGNTIRQLPDTVVAAKGYALIVSSGCESQYAAYHPVIGIPVLNITDVGQRITLYSDFDEVIHTVNFKSDWHTESFKKDGGWSLEMIDLNNPCGASDNWNSSVSLVGGTPCAENSVLASNPDVVVPKIRKIGVESDTSIILYFSEPVFLKKDAPPFSIDHGIEIKSIVSKSLDNQQWRICLISPLQIGVVYSLTVIDSVCDCVNQVALIGGRYILGLPENAENGEVVINEILSDSPGSTDADYIELYNRSDKIISLGTLRIGSGGDAFPEKSCIVDVEGKLLFPKNYVAICKKMTLTEQQYFCPCEDCLVQCDSLPQFQNSSGIVHLTDSKYEKIDRVNYDAKMHYGMLNSTDGVSFEKIHFDILDDDFENWKSAAASVGFGTPGYQNSQFAELALVKDKLCVSPEIFSPDNDGFNDFTEVLCQFPETETRATIAIYNKEGYRLKLLINNQLCGLENRFLWDGTTDKGTLAPPGIYFVQLNYWTVTGKTKTIRKVVCVAKN